MNKKHLETIAILDFGSQYTQLIARRIRENNIYSEIFPFDIDIKRIKDKNIKAIILSGGPSSVYDDDAPKLNSELLSLKIPILGICQGMQLMGVKFGSKLVKVKNHIRKNHKLINLSKEEFPKETNSYHQYSLKNCPKNFFITTKSLDGNIESIKHKVLPWEGWMWHPERDNKINKINNLRLKKIFG